MGIRDYCVFLFMNGLKWYQLTYIIVAAIIVAGIIFLCIYIPLRSKYKKINYRQYYHDLIYKIAVLDDYYLINDFKFKTDDCHTATIDEILIGEKYFYIITCLYFEGELTGKETDSSLIFIPKIGPRKYTDNPFLETKRIIQKLSLRTGIDTSLMIGIVLVNDNCDIHIIPERRKDGSEILPEEKIYFSSKRKDFEKLIHTLEKRDVGKINEEQLAGAIRDLDKMNGRKR